MRLVLLFLSVLFLFTGCVSSGWESSMSVPSKNSQGILTAAVPKNSSYIYVYREDEFRGSATAWHLQLNNEPVGKLKNGSYLLIKTNPGEKMFNPDSHVMGLEDKPFTLDAQGGKAYFLKHGNEDIFSSEVTFFPKPATEIRTKLKSYSLVNIHEMYDSGFNEETYNKKQLCYSQPNAQACIVQIEDVIGKIVINRGNSGLRAKPGMLLQPNDVIITSLQSAAYFLLYGEPKMTREDSSFKIEPLQ
ncbi:MAG: DUF2846 domain-containing protein [Arcobacter sp.]|uniref:DUF2846 domain-containing protein n=1 Tax=Arcobacter sp. TaxID=1872629 RepID=UPI003AFFDFF8